MPFASLLEDVYCSRSKWLEISKKITGQNIRDAAVDRNGRLL